MSSNFYEEILLREEFKLVADMQRDKEFAKYVTVNYQDRITGDERSVLNAPEGPRYPEIYLAYYRMPVYTAPHTLQRGWEGKAEIRLAESVLQNKHNKESPYVTFTSNFIPFNNHVLKNSICTGNAWAIAKDNGLWHFIISLGALINQDEFVSAEGNHFNGAAYDYWVARGRRPVTEINWPLDLLKRNDEKIDLVRRDSKLSPQIVFNKKDKKNELTLNIVPKELKIVPKEKPKNPSFEIVKKIK